VECPAVECSTVPDVFVELGAAAPDIDVTALVNLGARLLGSGLARAPEDERGAEGRLVVLAERDVAIFAPRSYDESRRITDLLRSNRAVVLNVNSVDPNLGRRLVDFASGTAYALNAKIEILGNSLYLMSPQGMHLVPKRRIDCERRTTAISATHEIHPRPVDAVHSGLRRGGDTQLVSTFEFE